MSNVKPVKVANALSGGRGVGLPASVGALN